MYFSPHESILNALKVKLIGGILGPLLFFLILFMEDIGGLSAAGQATLACTAWVAIWWMTETIDIAATALLPLVLFPLSGAASMEITSEAYGHPYIFLFVGGFIIAKAIEKWNLHKRIALSIIKMIGTNISNIVLGFMVATAFLSMWISNTATSVMMLPIGLAVVNQIENSGHLSGNQNKMLGKALMIAIAYSASIGGIATLIGTPPNLVLAGILEETFKVEISFQKWLSIGLPFSVLLLFVCWQYLVRFAFPLRGLSLPNNKETIRLELSALGRISYEEKAVAIVFGLTAFFWVTKSFILEHIYPKLTIPSLL